MSEPIFKDDLNNVAFHFDFELALVLPLLGLMPVPNEDIVIFMTVSTCLFY